MGDSPLRVDLQYHVLKNGKEIRLELITSKPDEFTDEDWLAIQTGARTVWTSLGEYRLNEDWDTARNYSLPIRHVRYERK